VGVVDSVDGTKTTSYVTSAVTEDRTVTATFEVDTYTVTCNVVGNGTCTATPATVDHGATSTIAVAPATGWHLVDVMDSMDGTKSGSYTTSAIAENRTVTATFAIDTFAIDCHAFGSGTCTATPPTVNYGETSYVAATPAPGWHIVEVVDSVEGIKTSSYTTSGVTQNRTVNATFALNTGEPPAADFVADVISGRAPLAVQFSDASAPGSAAIGQWDWNFGDGETLSGDEANPAHTYQNPGTYTVTLTVTSADGADSVTKTYYITVQQGLPASGYAGLLIVMGALLLAMRRYGRKDYAARVR
jgi:hypothetical protein